MATDTLAVQLNPSQQPECHSHAAAAPPSCDTGTTKPSKVLFLLPAACCAFMLYSSFTTIWDSHGDPLIVFFIVFSLFVLALLYFGMRQFEKAVADKNVEKRDLSMAGVDIFCTAFVVLLYNNKWFSNHITSFLQPFLFPVITWGVPAAMRQIEKVFIDKDLVKRERLKVTIWTMAMILNILFSYHVTPILWPPVMAGFMYGTPLVLCMVGCCCLLYHPRPTATNFHEPLVVVADPEEGAREA